MKIVIFEFIDEVKVLLKKTRKDFFLDKDVSVICFHPKVRIFLNKKGISSGDTIKYLDNEAQSRIIKKTEEITLRLVEEINLTDVFGIKNGYQETFIHHLRLYINHFLWIIEVLGSINKKHKITQIHCPIIRNYVSMYKKKGYIQDSERFLGFLVEDFCKINNIEFFGYEIKGKRSKYLSVFMARAIRIAGQILASIEYSKLNKEKLDKDKYIVIPSLSYNMGNLLRAIEEKSPQVKSIMLWEDKFTFKREVFKVILLAKSILKIGKKEKLLHAALPLDLLRKKFKKNHRQIYIFNKVFNNFIKEVNLNIAGLLTYKGIAFNRYLLDKIDIGLRHEIISLQHSTLVLYHIFKRLRPKLLMAMYSVGPYYMMGELSHILGFPSLNISHGTHVPPNNQAERIENYRLATSVIINTYKHVAVQTPWTDKFLNFYEDDRPRVMSGPLLYSIKRDDLRLKVIKQLPKKASNKKIILHATTQKARNALRFHMEETLDEYISSLIDLTHAVNSLDDTYLIIRPHPVCDMSEREFHKLLPVRNRLSVVKNGPFVNLLSIADLLVSYSSTCIEEALQSNIPVILYDKWQRYNHFNVDETKEVNEVKRSPVYYFTDNITLNVKLQKVINIFKNNPLTDSELIDFKYPKEYRKNFFNFVNSSLEGKEYGCDVSSKNIKEDLFALYNPDARKSNADRLR
ncbi:MAG: hypothetical protein ABH872_07675 [Candidatus Omnitrophota bacterium]